MRTGRANGIRGNNSTKSLRACSPSSRLFAGTTAAAECANARRVNGV
jgi:hypothetical protein